MKGTRWRISRWQLLLIVFTLSLCVTPFALPPLLVPVLGARAAWLGTLPAFGVGLWGIAVTATLAARFPGQSVDRLAIRLLGPVFGYIYLAALAALFLAGAPANLLVYTGAAHAAMLPHLPRAYVAILVAAVGTYAARSGPETIARCAGVLAPLLLGGLAAIYLPLLLEAHFGVLLPLRPLAWRQWLSPPVLGASGTIRGFLPLLVLGPLTTPSITKGPLLGANALAWVLVVAAVMLPVTIFDAPLAREMSLPLLAAEGTMAWHWLPLRNLVPLVMLVWYVITFVVFATYLWMGAWLLERLLPFLPRRGPALAFGVAAAVGGSFDLEEPTVRAVFITWNVAVVVLGVLMPTALCLARKGGGGRGREHPLDPPGSVRRDGAWRRAHRAVPLRRAGASH